MDMNAIIIFLILNVPDDAVSIIEHFHTCSNHMRLVRDGGVSCLFSGEEAKKEAPLEFRRPLNTQRPRTPSPVTCVGHAIVNSDMPKVDGIQRSSLLRRSERWVAVAAAEAKETSSSVRQI